MIIFTFLSWKIDICYVRLDFELFNIIGPDPNIQEADGGACSFDKLVTTVHIKGIFKNFDWFEVTFD